MSTKTEKVLVFVFGATTGVTLYEFMVGRGFRFLWKKQIPWITDGQVYVWPMDWLKGILDEVKAMATPGTIITSAMWGADVVHMYGDEIVGKVLHYRSVPPEFAGRLIKNSGISNYEWSRLMGNVHPAFYQAVFSSCFWREYTRCDSCLQIIPLADWITWQLSGQKGHDRVMLHNQGLGVPTSRLVNNYFDNIHHSLFAPVWPEFCSSRLVEAGDGKYVVPCTHDSALARAVLASTGLSWGLWTGSWYGICKILNGKMSDINEDTFNAGLVAEAMPGNEMSAISNIGMHGPLYKALKNVNGEISYESATKLALARLDPVVDDGHVFYPEALSLKPDDFASFALEKEGGDLSLALAVMVNTIAVNCKSGLSTAASALGSSTPSNVAMVGGFSENKAIMEALRLNGVNVVVPPFAELATQAGAAAHALCLAGMARNIKESLEMFPNVELTE